MRTRIIESRVLVPRCVVIVVAAPLESGWGDVVSWIGNRYWFSFREGRFQASLLLFQVVGGGCWRAETLSFIIPQCVFGFSFQNLLFSIFHLSPLFTPHPTTFFYFQQTVPIQQTSSSSFHWPAITGWWWWIWKRHPDELYPVRDPSS